jgi:thiamine-phosphate pyrophosphorylase
MELVVISPEGDQPDEVARLEGLFAAGLERYHVRKPSWNRADLERWLKEIREEWRARMVLHSHHELAEPYGLLGCHWKDSAAPAAGPTGSAVGRGQFTSCSCHRLEDLRARLGRYDSIFYSPVFESDSKPGRPGIGGDQLAELCAFLQSAERRLHPRTRVIALSGITPDRARECAELGFDGVAVMGGIPARPEAALHHFLQYRRALLPPVMCLVENAEQALQLCAAGARFIQLRCKGRTEPEWLGLAREVVRVCRAHGARCIINDRPDIAVAAGADGAHVGNTDMPWPEARVVLGSGRLLGGTVNDASDAVRAVEARCLDYVGVGPLRFTTTKQKLAPVLGLDGISRLLAVLGATRPPLPAWVIGGVQAADLAALREAGAAGVAVSSVLYSGQSIATQFAALAGAWPGRHALLVS